MPEIIDWQPPRRRPRMFFVVLAIVVIILFQQSDGVVVLRRRPVVRLAGLPRRFPQNHQPTVGGLCGFVLLSLFLFCTAGSWCSGGRTSPICRTIT